MIQQILTAGTMAAERLQCDIASFRILPLRVEHYLEVGMLTQTGGTTHYYLTWLSGDKESARGYT